MFIGDLRFFLVTGKENLAEEPVVGAALRSPGRRRRIAGACDLEKGWTDETEAITVKTEVAKLQEQSKYTLYFEALPSRVIGGDGGGSSVAEEEEQEEQRRREEQDGSDGPQAGRPAFLCHRREMSLSLDRSDGTHGTPTPRVRRNLAPVCFVVGRCREVKANWQQRSIC